VLTAAMAIGCAAVCVFVLATRLMLNMARHGASLIGQRTEADLALLFIFVPARTLLTATLAMVTVAAGLGLMLGIPWPVCVAICGVLAVAPRIVVRLLRSRWQQRLTRQLPDALSLWAGLLRTGQAMTAALTQVAAHQASPLGPELRLVLSQYRLGIALEAAIGSLRERAAVADLNMLATLLRANRELGGNLAEAMERLATTLRNRLAMQARIHSLTAQGRLQGVVVGILPLMLGAVLVAMEPVAMQSLVKTGAGWAVLGVIVALEVAGFLLIRRIVNIDV
jgi:tight adherence protein B